MVNRDNWLAVQAYLKFMREMRHVTDYTINANRGALNHVLRWADATPFQQAYRLPKPFSEYMNGLQSDRSGRQFTDGVVSATMSNSQRFLTWAREHLPAMRSLRVEWIESFTPLRRNKPIINERTSVTLETVRALVAVDWLDLRGRRARAAAAFLFLSGMRVTAFGTMPVKAVNLDSRTVRQDPAIGVQTKFRKRATTTLLDIPDLLTVVQDWDREVRANSTTEGPWFYRFPTGAKTETDYRCLINREIKELFNRAGIKPLSPHKFRHGHAEYAMKLAQNVGDYKAVSQNLMHSNIGITDSIYAILSESDMRDRIDALGKGAQPATPQAAQPTAGVPDVAALIEETVKRLMQAQADQAAQAQPAETKPRKPRKARGAE